MVTNYNEIQPLNESQVDGWFYSSDGMYCVYHVSSKGVDIDVYRNKSMKDLIYSKRNIKTLGINRIPLTAKDAKKLNTFVTRTVAWCCASVV